MGLQLPGELIEALSWLGMTWPEADEDLLRERGDDWMAFGRAGSTQRETADHAVTTMLATNTSPGLDRFTEVWDRVAGDWGHLHGSVVSAEAIAVAYYACSALVLAMKLAVIAQLVALAIVIVAAIAAAAETLGASLAAAAAYARTVFTVIGRIVRTVIMAIEQYGPQLAGVVGSLAQIGTIVLDARPVHSGPGGQDGPETEAEKQAREAELARRRAELEKDPDHGGRVTATSRREAEIGLGLESTGALPEPVTRGPRGSDLRDGNGQDWDVKGFRSMPGQRGDYDHDTAETVINKEISQSGNNIVLDLSGLSASDRADLLATVKRHPEWAGKVKVY